MGGLIINFLLYFIIFQTLAFGALSTPSYIYATDEKYDGKIWLQWGGVSGATYYNIYYKEPNKTTFNTKKYTVAYEGSIYSETFYTSNEGIYTFKVQACDSSGCGNFTSEESGSIQPKLVPSDVSGVNASDGSYENKISIVWNSVSNTTSYKILIHTPSDSNGVYSITKTSDSNSYEYLTTTQGTFYFKIQACNEAGCGNESSPESGSIKAPTPPTQKPTNLSATDGNYQNSIKITWDSVANATYYKLFYKSPNDTNFQELSIYDTFYYLETSIYGNYTFKVEGCNSDGCSPISDSDIGSIAEIIPSSAPTELSATNGIYSDKINLSWDSVANATHYKVYIKAPNTSIYSYEYSNTNSFDYYTSIEGDYYFKIQACNGVGCSTLESNEVSGSIKVLPPSSPPTNLNATNAIYDDKIKISWNSVENATAYYLYFKEPSNSSYSTNYINLNSTSYDYITNTTGIYYFKVKACNSGGCSTSYSNEVSGNIKEIILPSPPNNFSASKGIYKDKIYLEWSKIEGASKYIIYYKAPNTTNFNSVNYDVVYDGNLYSYHFSSYTEGIYTFKIATCNSNGCGEMSSEITGYIKPATAPETPINLQASNEVYEDKIELNWEATLDTTYYNILIHKPSDENGAYSLTKTATTNSYTYNTIEVGVHYFKIEACNDSGCSTPTSPIEGSLKGKTKPSIPLNLSASNGDYQNSIKISWSKSEEVAYYKLFVQKPNSNYYEIASSNIKDNFYYYSTSIQGNFYFKLQACNSVGCSEYSDIVSGFIELSGLAESIQNLTTSKDNANKITIDWDLINGINCYKLYYREPLSSTYKTLDFLCFESDENSGHYDFETTKNGNYYFSISPCIDKDTCGTTSSQTIGYIKEPLNFSPALSTINIPYSKYLRPNHFFIYITKDEGLKSSNLTFYINNTKVTPLDISYINDENDLIIKLPFDKLSLGKNIINIKSEIDRIDIEVNTSLIPFREAFENAGFSWTPSGGIGKELKFEVEILGTKIELKSGISATLELTHRDGIDTIVIADDKESATFLYGIPIEDSLSAKVEATLLGVEGNILGSESAKAELNLGNVEGGTTCTLSHIIYPTNLYYPTNQEEIGMFLIPYIGQQIIPSINSFAQIGSQILKNQSSFYKDIYKTDCTIKANSSLISGDVSISTQQDSATIGTSVNIKGGEYEKLKRTIITIGSENGKNINLLRKYYNNYFKDGLRVLYLEYGVLKDEYITKVALKLSDSIKYDNLQALYNTKEITYYLSDSDYNALLLNSFDIDKFFNYQFSTPTLIQTTLNSAIDSLDLTLLKVSGAIGIEVGGELKYSSQNYESILYELDYKVKDKSYTIYRNSDKTYRSVDLSKFYGKDLIIESLKSIDKDKLNSKLESYLKSLIGDIVNTTKEVIKEGVYEIKNEANKQIAKIGTGVKILTYKVKNLLRNNVTNNLNSANLTFVSDILAIEVENENLESEIYIYPQYGTLENSSIFKYSTKNTKWEKIESEIQNDSIKFNIKESGLYAIIKDFISSENDIFTNTSINIEPNKDITLTSNPLKTTLNSVASNKSFNISLSDTFILNNGNAVYGESPIEINSNIEANSNGELELNIISNSNEGEATININSNEGYLTDSLKVYVIKEDSLKPIKDFNIDITLSKSKIVVGDSIDINIISNKNYVDEDISIISPNGEEIKKKNIEIDKKGEWRIIVKLQDTNEFWHQKELTFEVTSSNTTNLNLGWNLKGNPLSVNLYTSDIKNLFGRGEYWTYEDDWIKNPSLIKPLQGFWIKSELQKIIKFEDIDGLDEKFTPSKLDWSLMGVEEESNLISILYEQSAEIIYTYQNGNWYNSNTNPNKILNIGNGYWLKN